MKQQFRKKKKKKKAAKKVIGKLADRNQIKTKGRNTQDSNECKSWRNLHSAYVCD